MGSWFKNFVSLNSFIGSKLRLKIPSLFFFSPCSQFFESILWYLYFIILLCSRFFCFFNFSFFGILSFSSSFFFSIERKASQPHYATITYNLSPSFTLSLFVFNQHVRTLSRTINQKHFSHWILSLFPSTFIIYHFLWIFFFFPFL